MAKIYKARNIKERIQQVTSWLRDTSPTQHPVRVRWTPMLPCKSYAEAFKKGRFFYITLSWKSLRGSRSNAIDTLIHEWSHAATWQEHRDLGDHPPEFWIEYGRLCVLWTDEDGSDEANMYRIRRVRIR